MEDEAETDWLSVFDLIVARYGYTLEQFYDLTLKQVYMMQKHIIEEKTKELEINARLHGKELQKTMAPIRRSKKESENIEKASQHALKILKRRQFMKGQLDA